MRRFTSIGCSSTSSPHTETRPSLGGMKPVIMRMVVDLPAPLGPRNPRTSPLPTSKEIPSTARFGPNDLLRFSTLIIALPVPGRCRDEAHSSLRGRRVISKLPIGMIASRMRAFKAAGDGLIILAPPGFLGPPRPTQGLRDDSRRHRELHQVQVHRLR